MYLSVRDSPAKSLKLHELSIALSWTIQERKVCLVLATILSLLASVHP